MDGTPIIIKKKKGHGGHGHHGGSWKVAYADFVTAMMAFFMVMWIMGLSDDTKTQIQGYFNDPMGFSKAAPLSKNIINFKNMSPPKAGIDQQAGNSSQAFQDNQELERTESEIVSTLKNSTEFKGLFKNIETDMTEEGLRVEFVEAAGSVFFVSGGSQIRSEALNAIRAIAPVLAKTGRPLIIEGHTDARQYSGSGYDNWDLSTDRAAAMRRALVSMGINRNQFMQVRGYAATKPRVIEDPYSFANRRVTVLLPFKALNDITEGLPKEKFKKEVQAAIYPGFLGIKSKVEALKRDTGVADKKPDNPITDEAHGKDDAKPHKPVGARVDPNPFEETPSA